MPEQKGTAGSYDASNDSANFPESDDRQHDEHGAEQEIYIKE